MLCLVCGKSIVGKSTRKYCSKACMASAFRKSDMLTCEACGKQYYLPPSHRRNSRACSMKCYSAYKKMIKPKEHICKNCGIAFAKKSASGKHIFCTRKCSAEFAAKRKASRFEKRVCPTCNKEFITSYQRSTYCSVACCRTTKERACKVCGQIFHPHSDLRKFCSKSCANKGKITSVKCVCGVCGKEFTVTKSMKERGKGVYCSQKCMYSSESWKKGALKGRIAQGKMKGDNSLEKAGNAILDTLGITYSKQHSVGNKFIVDVFLPEYNTVIQWDGDYWHGYKGADDKRVKKRVALDISQDAYMKALGIKVIRFWEHDVKNNKEYVIRAITEAICVKGKTNA